MKRVLVGGLAVVVVAIAGVFGAQWYIQHRVDREVETAFEAIRAAGGKASHGKVGFDLRTRTVTIADITSTSTAEPPVSVTIGSVIATGVDQPGSGRFAAASIELKDVEVGAHMSAGAAAITYKAPRVLVKDYAGPDRLQPPPAATSLGDVYRYLVERFIDVSASSVTVPRMTGTMSANAAGTSGEFTYSGLVAEGIKGGRIARHKLDEVNFTMTLPEGPGTPANAGKMTGRVADIVHLDIDANALVASLSPDGAKDDRVHRIYQKFSTGAYEIKADQGVRVSIDGLTADDVGVQPSKLQLPALLAALPKSGAKPTPGEARDLTDKVAALYEGVHIASGELRGLSIETPQGPLKLASIRLNLDGGKGDIVAEGLDGRAPQGPVKLGRLALKSFDVAGLMRFSAQFATPGAVPDQGQALALLKLLGGFELKNFSGPFKSTNKLVKIDDISLNWGQFVGPIPTRAHLVAKLAGPVDASNPALLPLLAAGIDTMAVDADVSAGWSESSGAFALSPVRIEFGNLVGVSAGLSLAHVPRELFTSDTPQVSAAAQVETGTFEFTLRDFGIVDLLVAQYARGHDLTREAARQAIIDSIKAVGEQANANPDAPDAVEAIVRFIETPRQTLTLKLTPRGTVPTMQLLALLRTEPPTALAQFRIEASTGL